MKVEKRHRKLRIEGMKKVSFILRIPRSNFVYAEGETTLSPTRQDRVVPLLV